MNLRINIYISLVGFCIAIFPATEALAQHCQPYWTAQYKCAVGCGPCGGGSRNVAPQPYVAPQPSPAQIAAQRANAITAEGVKAENAGKWALAVSLYEQALRLRPNDRVIMNNLGHARAGVLDVKGDEAQKAGNWALAIRLFEQALQETPKSEYYAPSRITLNKNIAFVRARMQEQAKLDEQTRQRQHAAQIKPVRTAQTTPAKNISNEWVCPPNLPQIASNPARSGEADGHYCIAKNSIACGGPSKSWACEAGHPCNGDGSDPKVPLCR